MSHNIFPYRCLKVIPYLISLFILLELFSGCGRRTPPKPRDEKQRLGDLSVIQRGEYIRLSWSIKGEEKEDKYFEIKEYKTIEGCSECPAELVEEYLYSQTSEVFIREGKRYYLYLPLFKEHSRRFYHLRELDHHKASVSGIQTTFLERLVLFPNVPMIQYQWLSEEDISVLQDFRFILPLPENIVVHPLKVFWQRPTEFHNHTYKTPHSADAPQRSISSKYKVNIYKMQEGAPWPEQPFNPRPLDSDFFVDYWREGETKNLYHIRLVDHQGNESKPSLIFPISREPVKP